MDDPVSSEPAAGRSVQLDPSAPDLTPPPTPATATASRIHRTGWDRVKYALLGNPLNLFDKSIFHTLLLIPVLAWVGLGSDGLSSSAYGPEEAFKALGEHTYLGVLLALATAATVFVLAAGYSALIESFPTGGGYVVATRMLGRRVGLVSGAALLVDYVLTITISLAAAGQAIFSLLPPEWNTWLMPSVIAALAVLMVLNMRGVKESILVLLPIFACFIVSHVLLIGLGIGRHLGEIPETVQRVGNGFQNGASTLGAAGMAALFFTAYAMGGGTYTGIEAVSNGLPLMREPRLKNAKRTMVYLAVSLAVAAGGIITCYLLWNIRPEAGSTMNASLARQVFAGLPGGSALVWITMASAAALLIAAAQAGFLAGPRSMSNLALDGWLPRSFVAMSERLVTANAILVLGAAAGLALWFTGGDITTIVVIYSINVFLTFTLTMAGMLRYWWQQPRTVVRRRRRIVLFIAGLVVCGAILGMTVVTKFDAGGSVALAATGILVALCLLIHSHYQGVSAKLRRLYMQLEYLPRTPKPNIGAIDPAKPVAAILVNHYGGIGIHTVLQVFRAFPGHFHGLVFIAVGVVDSGRFKGEDSMEELKRETEANLAHYRELAASLGLPSESRYQIGLDVIDEAEQQCLEVAATYPRVTFFAGKVVFGKPQWYHWLLHNDTAMALQRRLQLAGRTMVVMPARL